MAHLAFLRAICRQFAFAAREATSFFRVSAHPVCAALARTHDNRAACFVSLEISGALRQDTWCKRLNPEPPEPSCFCDSSNVRNTITSSIGIPISFLYYAPYVHYFCVIARGDYLEVTLIYTNLHKYTYLDGNFRFFFGQTNKTLIGLIIAKTSLPQYPSYMCVSKDFSS